MGDEDIKNYSKNIEFNKDINNSDMVIDNNIIINNNNNYVNDDYNNYDNINDVFNDTYLFEISWEVCNKVGGIYTVINSKLNAISKYFNSKNNFYYLIGPYLINNGKNINIEFEEINVPENFKKISEELLSIGIRLHFGIWKTKINPNVILIEFQDYSYNINPIKGKIWELYKIDSLNSNYYDWDEPILWSWSVGLFIEKFNKYFNNKKILVHSHEWMSGGAILYLKSLKNKYNFNTIFTTHATMLGRSICANGINLYELEKLNLNIEKKAYEIGVHTKHQTEKVLANISDCFTTVSDITARESEFFFNKKPDILLYNGFDNSNINFEDLNINYLTSRENTNLFLKKYFHNFYDIDLDNTQIFYTSGRFEFKNKGIDLLIDSANKLNKKLKEEKSNRNIILFLLVMMGRFNKNKEVEDSIRNYSNDFERNFELDFAPISTHEIPNDNIIIRKLIENNLLNSKNDKVKIILIPEILDGRSEIFNFNYYDLIKGFDLGIFPSYYEPWGYTPLESISYGVPTITSNLAGFGIYIKNKFNTSCVKVLDRKISFDESSNILSNILFNFTKLNQKELLIEKDKSKDLAFNFDWNVFIKNYFKAYKIALTKNKINENI